MFDTRLPCAGASGRGRNRFQAFLAGAALASLALGAAASARSAFAAAGSEAFQGTSSSAARRAAVQSIPFDKLDADARRRVASIVNNAGIYRRLPVRTVTCDPELYLFLVRHPDVVVNIWEVLGVSQVELRQTDIDSFRVNETEGTTAAMEFVYHNRDMQIVYGSWTYTGPLLARKINGHCLAILKASYAKDANGRYYVTAKMDGFLSVDSGGVDLVARTLQPLVVKNVDNNFIQTVSFLGSVSKSAEVNPQGMQRLVKRLSHVQDATRQQMGEVVTSVAQRAVMNAAAQQQAASASRVAGRPQGDAETER